MKFHATHTLIDDAEFTKTAASLNEYRAHLRTVAQKTDYADPECSLQLPSDDGQLERAQALVEAIKTPTLQYIVVIGIGGSNLGTQAVYDAIAGSMSLLYDRLPKLLFLDTVSDERMTAVVRILSRMPSREDFAIISVSKSGGTTETISNTEVLWRSLEEQFGDVRDRFCFITDEGSNFWKASEQHKTHRIAIPKQVGGRYSVMSAVGLVPLLLGKIDIEAMRSGARDALQDNLSDDLTRNHALVSAACTYIHSKLGRSIHNSFVYAAKLESLGKWYRQLMGESVGKEKNLNGDVVNAGITPIVSIGSTDLHSMAQLYYGGPDDKFTNIIYSFKGDINLVPREMKMPGLVQDIGGKSLEQITAAIVGGVKAAYKSKQRPFLEIDMEGITPRELGYYLQFRMIEMMYLAHLMNVNAFNQPAVESYKEATRDLLKA